MLVPCAESALVEVHGHRYAEEKEEDGRRWKLLGAEHFRYGVFSVFTGALYLGEDGGRQLAFTYTRSVKAEVLRGQALRVLRGAYEEGMLTRWAESLEKMNGAFVNVVAGDQYTLTMVPGEGVWLHLNGKERVFIADSEFGTWYLSIWLGEKPMSVPLRDALLAEKGKK